jgi:glucosamine--fructose-6-phosphate aminotransferase (isomerizing)
MCGIAAVCRSRQTGISHLKSFVVEAALDIESRGPHATGFAWAAPADGHPWYWKSPGPARKVAHKVPLPNGVGTILVHTRWATHGKPEDNRNNHPVVAPGLTLIHNGVLTNHRDLLELLNVEPDGECDSEALAWLLANGPDQLGAQPWELLELVEGSAAIAWLEASEPHVMHLARLATRPMAIGWTNQGDMVMASTTLNLRGIAKRTKTNLIAVKTVPEGTYLRVEDGKVTDTRSFRVTRPVERFRPPPRVRSAAKPSQKVVPAGHDGLVLRINDYRAPREETRQSWSDAIKEWEGWQ